MGEDEEEDEAERMNRKRMWSEGEITGYMFGCIIIAVIISFFVTLFMLSFYSNLKGFIGAEWQPINCVNETKIIVNCSYVCVNYLEIPSLYGFRVFNYVTNETYFSFSGFNEVGTQQAVILKMILLQRENLTVDYEKWVITSRKECNKHEKLCNDIEVPTGRQICSQEILVRNKTTIIGVE